ncbi:MAG: hypothetical protein U0263_19100 [Polyangiaceae bacterium]
MKSPCRFDGVVTRFAVSLALLCSTARAEGEDAGAPGDAGVAPAPVGASAANADGGESAELAALRRELDEQKRELARQREAIDELSVARATAEVGPEPEAESGSVMKIYGYLDVGYQKLFLPDSAFLAPLVSTRAGTFLFGNLNLFFDVQPRDQWRALMELRFTNVPHGQELSLASPAGTRYERVDNRVPDTTSSSGRNQVLLGSVIIERAQIMWSPADAFQLIAGYWLTPFGIWNVDHGTPTLISLQLPSSQVEEFFPAQQLGLQALGSIHSDDWEYGYHASVSNGRMLGQVDYTEDKAIGYRLFVRHRGDAHRWTLGTSGYYGRYTDIEKRITSFDPFVIETDTTVKVRECAAGLDLSLDSGPVRVRVEATGRRVAYVDGKRAPTGFGAPGTFEPDKIQWDGYVLGAYRLPYAGLEPYLWFEAEHGPNSLGDTVLAPSAGLNVHLSPEAQLKLQYVYVFFEDLDTSDGPDPSENNFSVFNARFALAF